MRIRARLCVGTALLTIPIAASAAAERIVVPVALPPALAAACPDCDTVLPCGNSDVQPGRRFQSTAMQGEPARAYLLLHGPTRDELSPLLGQGGADELAAALAERIGAIRLLAVDGDWRTVRVLQPAAAPTVTVDAAQQACFADPGRSLGCCLGDGPPSQGCLPKADPPSANVLFQDGDEPLTLRYPVGRGEVTIRRGRLVYWCLAWARARLVPK